MDQDTEEEEIKPLIFNYIFHIVLFIFYLVLHLIIHSKVYWIFKSLGIIFAIGSFFNIIYFLFPIFPFIIIFKRKFKKNIMIVLKTTTFILLIIVIIFGLILTTVILVTSLKSKIFCKECPFNFNIKHLNDTFGQYYRKEVNKDEIKDKCSSRRCVFDKEDLTQNHSNIYLCNYDPSEEFNEDGKKIYKKIGQNGEEITVDKQLICHIVSSNYKIIKFSYSQFYLYLDLCYYYADFYRCQRFTRPEKDFNLGLKDDCPDNNYLLLAYILCVLVVIMDVIIALLPWSIEYITFKKLVTILSVTRRKANSNNSTAKSSEISQDEHSFKKEKTPVIIIEREIQNNNLNINIDNDDDLIIKLENNKVRINKIDMHNNSEDEKDIYKTNIIYKNKTSERAKLNTKNIEIEVNSEDKDIYMNNLDDNIEDQIRKKIIKKKLQSTTLLSNQGRPLEIKIDNKNYEN